jgi:hypothetical protein
MKTPKKPITLRLSELTIKELTDISQNKNISLADVISVLVHWYYLNNDIKSIEEWFDISRMS